MVVTSQFSSRKWRRMSPRLRPERAAGADLPRALGHGEGRQAHDPERRDQHQQHDDHRHEDRDGALAGEVAVA